MNPSNGLANRLPFLPRATIQLRVYLRVLIAQRGPCTVKYRSRFEPDEVIEEEELPAAVAVT